YQMNRIYNAANFSTINTVPSINSLYEIQNHFNSVQIAALQFALATDNAIIIASNKEIQDQRAAITKELDHYEANFIADDEERRLAAAIRPALKEYYTGLESALAYSRQNKSFEMRDTSEKNLLLADKVEEAIQRDIDYNKNNGAKNSAEALSIKNNAFWTAGVGTTLMLLLIGIAAWVISKFGLVRPISLVVDNLQQLAAGRMDVTVSGIERRDEVGDIARAAQVFKDFVDKLNTQSWIKSQSAEIMSALQQAEDLLALTQTAVSRVAPAIGAGHGAFYVADAEECYILLATYGCRERKQLNNRFQVGEGLVGQCVMEKSPIMITAPKDYIRIHSGLGDGTPACVIVLPILHRDRVLGVLEMASFQQFGEREKNLLEALLPVLATSMEILDRNLRTRELLVSTQEQAERMEKQAAQLEEQSVEMEAQQAELLETEHWYRSIIETAPDGMLVVDGAGQILLANPRAEEMFGYAAGELVGCQVEQLVPEPSRGSHSGHRRSFMAENRTRMMGEGPELRGLRKDGSEFELYVTLSPLPSRGTRGSCVSVAMRAR
ncbi:MAG TPA: PAS domain S-box protein, partial [Geobacteraceae bacterium]